MTVKDIAKKLFTEIDQINETFLQEINLWQTNTLTSNLIIIGEAPLSSNQFFYQNSGNYLSFLKSHYINWDVNGKSHQDWLDFLRTKGILNVDCYRYPIPSEFYNEDKNFNLYNETHCQYLFSQLTNKNIISPHTKFMYRYPKLIKRGIPLKAPFNAIPINNHFKTEAIAIGANAATLNPNLAPFLP
jgi:hypothetical protein